jgi:hypothetical protein
MEGTMFYLVYWCFWIFLTFILSRQNPHRLKLSAVLLIQIILANIHFRVAGFDVYAGGLFILLLAYASSYQEKLITILYFCICSFIVMIAYGAFHLFEIFDPVWIIFNKDWMMGICLCYLAILLQKDLRGRLLIIASGTMQGEILYAYILKRFDFPYPIGAPGYLDVFAISSILLTVWSCLENFGAYFENNLNISQKGRQKSSS